MEPVLVRRRKALRLRDACHGGGGGNGDSKLGSHDNPDLRPHRPRNLFGDTVDYSAAYPCGIDGATDGCSCDERASVDHNSFPEHAAYGVENNCSDAFTGEFSRHGRLYAVRC